MPLRQLRDVRVRHRDAAHGAARGRGAESDQDLERGRHARVRSERKLLPLFARRASRAGGLERADDRLAHGEREQALHRHRGVEAPRGRGQPRAQDLRHPRRASRGTRDVLRRRGRARLHRVPVRRHRRGRRRGRCDGVRELHQRRDAHQGGAPDDDRPRLHDPRRLGGAQRGHRGVVRHGGGRGGGRRRRTHHLVADAGAVRRGGGGDQGEADDARDGERQEQSLVLDASDGHARRGEQRPGRLPRRLHARAQHRAHGDARLRAEHPRDPLRLRAGDARNGHHEGRVLRRARAGRHRRPPGPVGGHGRARADVGGRLPPRHPRAAEAADRHEAPRVEQLRRRADRRGGRRHRRGPHRVQPDQLRQDGRRRREHRRAVVELLRVQRYLQHVRVKRTRLLPADAQVLGSGRLPRRRDPLRLQPLGIHDRQQPRDRHGHPRQLRQPRLHHGQGARLDARVRWGRGQHLRQRLFLHAHRLLGAVQRRPRHPRRPRRLRVGGRFGRGLRDARELGQGQYGGDVARKRDAHPPGERQSVLHVRRLRPREPRYHDLHGGRHGHLPGGGRLLPLHA